MRAPALQTFLKLKLPNALPFVFAGLKTASVLSVVGAIVGEFLSGGGGLGELIRIAGTQLSVARVFAFVTLLSVAGYLFHALVAWVERKGLLAARRLGRRSRPPLSALSLGPTAVPLRSDERRRLTRAMRARNTLSWCPGGPVDGVVRGARR